MRVRIRVKYLRMNLSTHALLPLHAQHVGPKVGRADPGSIRKMRHQPPVVDDQDLVESFSTSSRSADTRRIAFPLSRASVRRLCTISSEPTSIPRVGWEAMTTSRVAGKLPGHHHFLDVPPGKGPHAGPA